MHAKLRGSKYPCHKIKIIPIAMDGTLALGDKLSPTFHGPKAINTNCGSILPNIWKIFVNDHRVSRLTMDEYEHIQ